MQVKKATYTIIYNGKNITVDVSKSLLSLRYTDKVSGEADDLEIELEDKSGKWQNEWYPQKGATLTASIHTTEGTLNCGEFMIDEIELKGPPDVIAIKAISAGFYSQSRRRKGYAHENKTLSEIVRTVAAKSGFKVVGTIENIRIGRSTQNRESDLRYLNRLAVEYGYNFAVKGKTVVFVKMTELERRKGSFTINKTELFPGYTFKDKTSQIFKGTMVKFHNPNSNKLVQANRPANFISEEKGYTDALPENVINGKKVENEEQANAIAEAANYRQISLQQTGSIGVPGNILMISGNNFNLHGMGAMSGVWHILSSEHAVSRSGYTCSADIKRVGAVVNESLKKSPKAKTTNKNYNVK